MDYKNMTTDAEVSLLLAAVVVSSIAGIWLAQFWGWAVILVPWVATEAVSLWLSVRRPPPCYKPPV